MAEGDVGVNPPLLAHFLEASGEGPILAKARRHLARAQRVVAFAGIEFGINPVRLVLIGTEITVHLVREECLVTLQRSSADANEAAGQVAALDKRAAIFQDAADGVTFAVIVGLILGVGRSEEHTSEL